MLKIDRGLVAQIGGRERDRIVVKATDPPRPRAGPQGGRRGRRGADQLDLLKEWGCDFYQGFLGSAPLTHEELTRFASAA